MLFRSKFVIPYYFSDECENKMKDAFDEKRSDVRKEWLRRYTPQPLQLPSQMSYGEFIDKFLIQYSYDNCDRSLPLLMDGLKECQRKILFTAKTTKNQSIKVAQLQGVVSNKTHYHHGEDCIGNAIINMAQNFVGSNNIPLFLDEGQFGTRLKANDAASPRYIFTKLRPEVNRIFPPADDAILTYLEDEGVQIEPREYAPIIPMVLVNGANAIGTGWSCTIPCYNPSDVAEAVRCWIRGESLPELTPWYKGFTGDVVKGSRGTYLTYGRIERDGKYVHVRELPVGMWIDKFKERLEDLRDGNQIGRAHV